MANIRRQILVPNEQDTSKIKSLICHACSVENRNKVEILKEAVDKRVALFLYDSEPYIVKSQLHRGLRRQLKAAMRSRFGHKQWLGYSPTYTMREYENTLAANRLQLPGPAMLGYGLRGAAGLVNEEVLVTKACPGTDTLEAVLQRGVADAALKQLLMRSFSLIMVMLRAGFVHLDLNSFNILIAESSKDRDAVIDFKYAAIFPDEMLIQATSFVFGYLFRCQLSHHVSYEEYKSLAMVEIKGLLGDIADGEKFQSWMETAATTRVGKKQRWKYLSQLSP